MSFNLKGLEGVLAQLKEVDAELGRDALAKAARVVFKPVLESARQKVPVDSGGLREAIAIRVVKPKKGDAVVAVGLVVAATSGASRQANMAAAVFGEGQSKSLPPARRWHFIEMGTANQPPQPFLRPALDENAQGIIDSLGVELRKQIAKALKKKSGGSR